MKKMINRFAIGFVVLWFYALLTGNHKVYTNGLPTLAVDYDGWRAKLVIYCLPLMLFSTIWVLFAWTKRFPLQANRLVLFAQNHPLKLNFRIAIAAILFVVIFHAYEYVRLQVI